MKKRICFLISSILLLLSFSSCVPDDDASNHGVSIGPSNLSVCALKYEGGTIGEGESIDVICFLSSPFDLDLPFEEAILKVYAKGFEISNGDGNAFPDECTYDYSEFIEDHSIKRFIKLSFKLTDAEAANGNIDFEFRCYPEINNDVTQTAVTERISFTVKNGVVEFS